MCGISDVTVCRLPGMISGLSVGLAKIFGVTVMLDQPMLHYITFTSTQFDSLLCCLMGPGVVSRQISCFVRIVVKLCFWSN